MTRSSLFTLAIWLGVCSGMLEGALYLLLQRMRWLAWNEALVSVGPDQIWISALFNLAIVPEVRSATGVTQGKQ